MTRDDHDAERQPVRRLLAIAFVAAAALVALLTATVVCAGPSVASGDRAAPRAFTLAGIDPNTGVSGQPVTATISGTGFEGVPRSFRAQLTQGDTVLGSRIVAVHPTTLTARFALWNESEEPAPIGTYDVVVTYNGTETQTLTGAFTVTSASSASPSASPAPVVPKITKITPTAGRRGTKVTIKGTGFGKPRGTGYVRFGAVRCTKYLSWAAGKIVCKVPPKARRAKVKVRVTTAAGTSNSKSFRVRAN